MSNEEKTINAAKQGFEFSFAEGSFYNKQTRDDSHLESILSFLPIEKGMKILDLGAGSGYLTFALAKTYPDVTVTGLDIVDKTLKDDQVRAENENISNISFVSYNGTDFPFNDNEFDMVVSRYALHHFPIIKKSISEVFRVLKGNGTLFISDPSPNDNDTSGFVDEFMQVKKDGHIKFRTLKEWINICEGCGFRLCMEFESSIRFPRKMENIYKDIIQKHDSSIVGGYDLTFENDEIYISETVNNMLFKKF